MFLLRYSLPYSTGTTPCSHFLLFLLLKDTHYDIFLDATSIPERFCEVQLKSLIIHIYKRLCLITFTSFIDCYFLSKILFFIKDKLELLN